MTPRGPAKGYCTLAPEEETCRLELYHAGLSDTRIAAAANVVPSAIWQWRRYRGLPTHPPVCGCPMEEALSPEQCAEMRRFLSTLVALAKELPPGQKLDVARFMAQWRKLRNQLYPMISDVVKKNPKGKRSYVNKQHGTITNSPTR